MNAYEWLEYSKEKDAAYCYPCRQFAISNTSDVFSSYGYSKWSKALSQQHGFKKHEATKSHLTAMLAWKEHSQRFASNQEISSLLNDTVLEKRRHYLNEIVSTVLFLARNELPFRGNWNEDENKESGLFNNLFKHVLEKDDHLQKCQEAMPKNAIYTSPQIQNEIISIIANCLREIIVKELNESSYLTLMADRSSDNSGN